MGNQNKGIIQVTGKGRLQVQPNIVQVQIDVVTDGTNLIEVQSQNAQITSRAIEAIVAFGIRRTDIQTANYQVIPQYDYIDGKQVFRGYEVRNSIVVTLRNINRAGQLIDFAIQQGVNQITSVQFKLENEQTFYNQALQLAVQNGKEKAFQIGGEIGVSYMEPIEIVEIVENREGFLRAASFSSDAPTPIEPGSITIQAEVKMKFAY